MTQENNTTANETVTDIGNDKPANKGKVLKWLGYGAATLAVVAGTVLIARRVLSGDGDVADTIASTVSGAAEVAGMFAKTTGAILVDSADVVGESVVASLEKVMQS